MIPDWVFKMMCYSNGARMPKKPIIEKPKPAQSSFHYYSSAWHDEDWNAFTGGSMGRGYVRPPADFIKHLPKGQAANLVGNLQAWEYRFWGGSEIKDSQYARCRACGTCSYSAQERTAHMEAHKCTTKLIQSYALLLKDMKCIVCDNPTTIKKWGIPICKGDVCMQRWMTVTCTPFALQQALTLREKLVSA